MLFDTERRTNVDLKHIWCRLAAGKATVSPFPEQSVNAAQAAIGVLLAGTYTPKACDRPQEVDVRLLQSHLRDAEDPDSGWFLSRMAERGHRLGVDRQLPRAPAIFERKRKWRLDPPKDDDVPTSAEQNYASARERPAILKAAFEADVNNGRMAKLTYEVAKAKYGESLAIAPMAALLKSLDADTADSSSWRLVHDGTRYTLVNRRIRVRDYLRYPIHRDLEAYLREMSALRTLLLSLTYDIEGAHRVPPVDEADWGHQAAKIEEELLPSTAIYVNKVGTFGISSAGLWWGRLMACIQRGTFYACGPLHPIWHVVYSDDGCTTGMGRNAHISTLLVLAYLVVMRAPVKWQKVHGGVQFEWTGYLLDLQRFELGITVRRMTWVSDFCAELVSSGRVVIRRLQEGLGRLGYVAGPLEFLRPFLGPIYAWVAAAPADACLTIPAMIRLVLHVAGTLIREQHVVPCQPLCMDLGEEFLRVDAKAEGETVVIGGWRSEGGTCTAQARWFGVTLTKDNAPWVFGQGEPFRIIATLELLAVLVGVWCCLTRTESTTHGNALVESRSVH